MAEDTPHLIEVPASGKPYLEAPPHQLSLSAVNINLLHGRGVIHSLKMVTNIGLAQLPTVMRAFSGAEAPPKLLGKRRRKDVVEIMHDITSEQAKTAVDAASIIYAHAMVDAAILRLCKVTVGFDRAAWLPLIERKQVTWAHMSEQTVAEVRDGLIERVLTDVERQSLPAKCDTLFSIIRPRRVTAVVRRFKYSRDRLVKIDRLRHDLVHKLHFNRPIRQVNAKVEYLFGVGDFFNALTARKYTVEARNKFIHR